LFAKDPESFDFEAMGKWIVFEQVFDLLCLLIMLLPGWFSVVSVYRNWFVLSFPRLRKKGLFVRRVYISLERGYRAANIVRCGIERNVVNLISHALVMVNLVFNTHTDYLVGFLLVRQFAALWQSLFTLSGIEFVSRKSFTTALNVAQILLMVFNVKLTDWLFSAMLIVYSYQLLKPLYGVFKK
jgi:hypothetical protein